MHEFIPEKINEQLDKEAVKAITATEEQSTLATGPSLSTQALTGRTEEGKLAFIIDVLWLPYDTHNLPCMYTLPQEMSS
jgi:hypothetical protein